MFSLGGAHGAHKETSCGERPKVSNAFLNVKSSTYTLVLICFSRLHTPKVDGFVDLELIQYALTSFRLVCQAYRRARIIMVHVGVDVTANNFKLIKLFEFALHCNVDNVKLRVEADLVSVATTLRYTEIGGGYMGLHCLPPLSSLRAQQSYKNTTLCFSAKGMWNFI